MLLLNAHCHSTASETTHTRYRADLQLPCSVLLWCNIHLSLRPPPEKLLEYDKMVLLGAATASAEAWMY